MKKFGLVSMMAWMAMASTAMANDQELYDPAPPADAAFVRVVNGAAEAVDVSVGSAAYAQVSKGAAAAYQVIKEGEYTPTVKVAGKSEQEPALKIAAGKYYTLAVVNGASGVDLKEMEDAQMSNPAKAYVYFYNLSDKANAAVRAPKFNKDVVAVTAAQSSASRDVGQATVDLAVSAEGKDVKVFPAVALQRRAGVSFVLAGSGDALTATMVNNEVKR